MSKFTPGPWKREDTADYANIIGPDDDTVIAHVGREDDANLISSAPEMYDFIKTLENDNGAIPEWLWKMRNDVLAKADGRAQ